MKKLVVLLLLFFSVSSFANSDVYFDPNDPVTPWPLEVGRQRIDSETLLGIWTSPGISQEEQWILVITPNELGRSYHWEIFLSSTPSLRSEGFVYIKDAYVIGKMQSPFARSEFLIMYLSQGDLHMQIGSVGGPRVEGIFKRKSAEFPQGL